MYENVSEKRKQELNLLKIWAECVGDTYYFSMPQAKFDKNMEGCEDEEFFKAYSRQREIGLKEFEKEISGRIASINSAEEIHYLLDGYNYDNGSWTIMQCLNNPCCDIRTARMVYWLMCPDYYLKFIEERVLSQGFVHILTSEYEDGEVPSPNEYAGRIPDSLFAGKD